DDQLFVVAGRLLRLPGVVERIRKIAQPALDAGHAQISNRGGVVRELVGLLVGIKRQWILTLGLEIPALSDGLCDGVGGVLRPERRTDERGEHDKKKRPG